MTNLFTRSTKLTLSFLGIVSLLLLSNCSNDDTDTTPVIGTIAANEITDTSANLEGQIITEGSDLITAVGFEYSNSAGFTEGTGVQINTAIPTAGVFIAPITGLTANTDYYFKAFATNSQGTFYGAEDTFKTAEPQVVDIDGNVYPIVTIGNQTWMAENLRVTQYANGRDIPEVTTNDAWSALENNSSDDAYSILYSNEFYLPYGLFYTYAAAIGGQGIPTSENVQGVCPKDWHLPNDQEWQELLDYVAADGQPVQALMSLKDWGGNGTDYYGFNLQASGFRSDIDGSFMDFERFGQYRSSSEVSTTGVYAQMIKFYQTDSEARSLGMAKATGICIRCIKD
ncbi:FISUMP domain-containing protein [Formosa sp. PL04]|uniref:FISUMP domain-containing protein n=1 Tax=Formosa sp. PL04 TaxID=3081755 RepID=UPI002981DAB8|nr:FISUMP domain-containing protein [Formosa sp. PL04]MDW5290351.1 FISUMP domain-containing protein [Formosa sp. PL04]